MDAEHVRTDPEDMRLYHESGQTMAEYGVALTVITIGCVTAVAFLAGKIVTAYERAASFIL
jgi:Flp pilus assembly pilin Flp